MILDEMDIQAVESKLNDVTVTAIPMSSVSLKQQNAAAQQKSNQYMNYHQQNSQLIQSAIQLHQQQQLQQQQQQINRLLADTGASLTPNSFGQSNLQQQASGLSKYAQLLAVIEEMGRDIRPTYANGRSSGERLKRSIIHAKVII